MADQKGFKEKKRSKFHRTLLNLYHPPSPPPPPPPPTLLLHEEEVLEAVFGNTVQLHRRDNKDFECESSSSDASDSAPKKLTRAQRKRIRKRKLKESASQRRKVIGPLQPPGHSQHESSEKPLQENICDAE